MNVECHACVSNMNLQEYTKALQDAARLVSRQRNLRFIFCVVAAAASHIILSDLSAILTSCSNVSVNIDSMP